MCADDHLLQKKNACVKGGAGGDNGSLGGSIASEVSGVSYGSDISVARSYTLVQWGTLSEDEMRAQLEGSGAGARPLVGPNATSDA